MLQKKSIELPIELVCANPDQPRKIFSEGDLEELQKSISEYGVLQPVIVKKSKGGLYFLIAGERRLRAARLAGLDRIPAIIKDFDDKDSALISIIENVQRENLSYIEEAYAYKKMIDDFGLSQGELALKVGKQQSTISNKLRILSLPVELQEKLVAGKLTERHARALLRLVDGQARNKVLDRVVANNLNVRQTEKLIDDIIEKEQREKRKTHKINYISYKIYINTIKKAFLQISEMEKNARFQQVDKGEYMEINIKIPKNNGCFT